jgi:hypothetical protein
LHLEEESGSLYDVVVQTVEGKDLLRFTGLHKELHPEYGTVIAVDIPSTTIRPGGYVLLLFDHAPQELRTVYSLQVVQ